MANRPLPSFRKGYPSDNIAPPDVSIDPINWGNLGFDNTQGFHFETQQITGINQPITLQVLISIQDGDFGIYYSTDSSNPSYDFWESYEFLSAFVEISDGETLNVENNQYVTFGVQHKSGFRASRGMINIKNTSDSDTIIDTFSASGKVYPM